MPVPRATPRDDAPPKQAMPARPAIRVLIVDDSVVVRRILAKVLGHDSRFAVAGAVSTGDQALAFAHKPPVDLVLLDMQMPGLDGLTVLPQLLERGTATQVVLLSATCREGSETALQALAMGASDVVAKPSAGHFSDMFVEHLLDRLAHLVPSAERSRAPEPADQASTRLRPPGTLVQALGIGALGMKLWSEGNLPRYRTLSESPAPVIPGAIHVVPDAGMKLADWDALLHALGLQVVGGPNDVGAYTVVPRDPGATEQHVLQRLRAAHGIRLAEPVTTTP